MDLKDRLLSSTDVMLGGFLGISSPPLMEMLGLAGFDFAVMDTEHGTFGLERMEDCLRAAAAVGMPCLVRVAGLNSRLIQAALDIGADGIQVPQIENANEASSAVEFCHFPPAGKRGFGSTTRAAGFGLRDRAGVIQKACQQTVVSIQIESREGVANLTEILAVPGVDVVFIGTSDLSLSYGFSTPNHPQIISLVEELVPRITGAGKVAGVYLSDWSQLDRLQPLGMRYFTISAGSLIKEAFRHQVEKFASSKRFV
ncbi:MAG: aldolase/citrate lyase family protein [Firmicutes bacterium]|nr:aldolase/citrate lyase family protein [Bacillota bacterium]